MFDKLQANIQFHQQALKLRHERHEVLAGNIANADTPNYKARDFDFSQALSTAVDRRTGGVPATTMQVTSSAHLGATRATRHPDLEMQYRVPAQASLDGNTVDMDRERTEFLDNSVRYQASLTLINSYIKGLRAAMQPE